MSDQLEIGVPARPPVGEGRVRTLAGVLAGFRWPGRESFQKLTKKQQAVALAEARRTLERLADAED